MTFRMKRFVLFILSAFTQIILVAQTQYDYMDDDAVAGGTDRALNAFIIIIILIIAAILFVFLANTFFNIYYWFDPKANPEYKKAKRIEEKKKEEERIISQKRKNAIPEAVDLGLSVKWASFNLGAYKPSDIGDRFSWTDDLSTAYTKDGNINVNAIGDISGIIEFDSATKLLGNKWRMPTDKECIELIESCSWETRVIDNIEGRLITGPNGNSIFLPFNQINYVTGKLVSGHYWTSCPSYNKFNESAQDLRFGDNNRKPAEVWCAKVSMLFCIRPVYSNKRITKEEKRIETQNAFSQIDSKINDNLESLYKSFEERSIIQDKENKKLYDPNKTYEKYTFTDEYGVVYSIDGKRLLFGGDCSCEIYEIRKGTEIICTNAFNTVLFPYSSSNTLKKRTLKKIILPSSLLYLTKSSLCDNCEVDSRSPYYSVINNLIIDNRKKSVVTCLDKYINEVTIGEPIEEIGPWAFANCGVLRKVTLPNTLRIIKENAFRNNEMLEVAKLPDSIETIEEDAFFYCKSLHIDRLPNKLIRLGNSTFNHCRMDGSVIPCNIAYIGNAPFPKSCINLQSLSNRFVIKEGLLIDEKEKSVIQLVDNSILNVTIPTHLTKIGSNAFHHCDIETITVPKNIVEIGSGTFWGCKKLTEVIFEGSTPCIPKIAFAYCNSLVSISLPHGVKKIESAAFESCKNLKTINLNDDLEVISNYAFIACPSLTSLKIPESVIVFGENFGSCFRDCPNLHELYYSSKNATVYGIPGSVTTLSIGEKVEVLPRWFIPNDSLIETLTIPENIRIVRNECIMGGPKLREITILSKDIVLEDGWTNCPNLKKISVRADMYETLLPQLPQKDGLRIEKIYPHHFLFFKW